MENLSSVVCDDSEAKRLVSAQFIIPTVVLGILNVVVLFGNSLVIVAVFTTHKLRTVTNLFIVSLAVADLSLGITVLPFSIANEVLGYWVFGTIWCNIWLAVDVWMCTASILNLVAISFDRYLAITQPFKYPHLMSSFRGKILIGLVWILSFLICFPPLIGWDIQRNSGENQTVAINSTNSTGGSFTEFLNNTVTTPYLLHTTDRQTILLPGNVENFTECAFAPNPHCAIENSEPGYIIYSAMGSFYLPSIVMVFFYLRIYHAAVKTTTALRRGVLTTKTMGSEHFSRNSEQRVTLRIHRGGGTIKGQRSSQYNSNNNQNHHQNGVNGHAKVRETKSERIVTNSDANKVANANNEKTNADRNVKKTVSRMRLKIKRSPACDFTLLDAEETQLDGGVNGSPVITSFSKRKHKKLEPCLYNESEEYDENGKKNSSFARSLGKRNLKTHLRKINRETKAAKTVGIIVGCFILCWCPFFTVYITTAFCQDCTPPLVFTVCFWLGYCNSAVNPCVYALFSKDFRYAFQKLLCCQSHRRRRSSRGRASLMTSIRIQATSKESDSLSDSK